MGFAGNLEDLCVADVLQILGLSRKTGLLRLISDADEVSLWMVEGRALGAVSKRGPGDLRELLLRSGLVAPERLAALAGPDSDALEERLLALDSEAMSAALERARRAALQALVVELFAWKPGRFAFEPGETPPAAVRWAMLHEPVAVESLAMEGARRFDERTQSDAVSVEDDAFGGLRFSGEDTGLAASVAPGGRAGDARSALVEHLAAQAIMRTDHAPELAPAPPARPEKLPSVAIVIEPELPALDWLRAALAPVFTRIHAFQRSEQGIARLRQYLARGEVPAVIVSDRAAPDVVSGARDAASLLERVRVLSPRAFTAIVTDPGSRRPAPRAASARLVRPQDVDLVGMARAARRDEAARRLRADLEALAQV